MTFAERGWVQQHTDAAEIEAAAGNQESLKEA
jgi:hypothetical protein